MGRLGSAFARARSEDRAALVVYLTAGDPSLALTPALVRAAAEAGADIVELGVPFSDPTADGLVLQRASERALAGGATFAGVLDAVRAIRRESEVPLVLFGYLNPILARGEARAAKEMADAGADGVLVVDMPVEECASLYEPARAHGLDWVPLVAPTSTDARVAAAAAVATSFVYYVSLTGVTGASAPDLTAAAERVRAVRALVNAPIAVGFGIKTTADVRVVSRYADGVVVGSALVGAVHEAETDEAKIATVRELVGSWRDATLRGGG